MGPNGSNFWDLALIFPHQTFTQSKREKNTKGGKKRELERWKNSDRWRKQEWKRTWKTEIKGQGVSSGGLKRYWVE